jgi:3-oxoacyl-[acyl-carrier protein] reductase
VSASESGSEPAGGGTGGARDAGSAGRALEGKVVLVTGGGTGIGRACSLAFAGAGARVAVNYSRSREEAEATAAECRRVGGRGRGDEPAGGQGGGADGAAIQADVSRPAEAQRLVEETVGRWGRLDVLINNAGTTVFAPYPDLDAITEEAWDSLLDLNLKAPFFLARAVAPHIRRAGGGSIVNVSSIAGLRPVGSSVPYCASKAAVLSLTQSLAVALAPEIRVNAIAPGYIETRWHAGNQMSAQSARERTPLRRNGTPEDCAEVALFLTTSAAFVTGEIVVVDGGRFLQ